MKIDKSLILAAGKGTRMGEIGKQLPKVLWPIYEKSILELEIDYLSELGCDRVFVNSYFYKDELRQFFEKNKINSRAQLIEESEEIDIGGAVHNLCAQIGYSGNLLVVNSDQFLMLDRRMLNLALYNLKNYDGVLFLTTVNSDDGYNQVVKDRNGVFEGVVQNAELGRNRRIETYIGVSLVKCEALTAWPGKSKFFESVAAPRSSRFVCINVDHLSYWDFGTIAQYYENMFKLIKNQGEFKQFLVRNQAILPSKIKKGAYGTDVAGAINLTGNPDLPLQPNSIYLAGDPVDTKGERAIVYRGITQAL